MNSARDFRKIIYHDALKIEFETYGIPFESERGLAVYYRGTKLPHTYVADLICYERILFGNTAKLQWQRVLISDNLIEDEIS